MLVRLMSCAATLMLLVVAAPAAAQRSTSDRDLLNRPHSGGLSSEDRKRLDELKQGEREEGQMTAARMAAARALRKTPPLPVERNGLLGSWRLGDGQRPKADAVDALTRRSGLGETLEALRSLDNFQCGFDWGGGITFTPSTFSWPGTPPLMQGRGGPVAYRSGRRGAKQVIVAITDYDFAMAFEIASPNSILDDKGCVLVRVGAPAATAALSATSGTKTAATGNAGAIVDGAAFSCSDGSLLHVSLCQGSSADAMCKLTELHKPGLQIGTPTSRAGIAARVKGCQVGGVRYGADDRPVFVR
jgi:hypothetical protein